MKKNFIRQSVAIVMAIAILMCDGGFALAASQSTYEENVTDDVNIERRESIQGYGKAKRSDKVIAGITGHTYPGLERGRVFSREELEDKQLLEAYRDDFDNLLEGEDCAPGEILVRAFDDKEALEYAKAFGGSLKEMVGETAVIVLPEKKNDEGQLITVASAVMAASQKENNLPAAWPNYYYFLHEEIYEDPFLSSGSKGYQWYHNVVGSKQAWEAGYTGEGVVVAVLDSGINKIHEDIDAVTVSVNDTLSDNDYNGHGTHVAGIIAAKNNGRGGTGIAPDASLLSIKVAGDDGFLDTADALRGINAAMTHGADIINMSLGGYFYHPFYEEKIQEAYGKGIAIFCSAGNDGADSVVYPASYEGANAVAALDKNNHRAFFSNYGDYIRYTAPGVDIASSLDGYADNYGFISGTSQATPIVSGAAAVILSSGMVEGEGSEKVDNLLEIMDESCIKAYGDGVGEGCISLLEAFNLTSATEVPDAPVFSQKSGTYTEGRVEVEISAPADCAVYYTINGKNITYKNGIISEGAIPYNKGDKIIAEGNKTVTLRAVTVNEKGGLASKVTTAKYILKPAAEELEIVSATGYHTVAAGKTLSLQAVIRPSYTADKKVEWVIEPAGSSVLVKNGKVVVKANAAPGEYKVTATAVKAASGMAATDSFVIQVVEGSNPVTSMKIQTKTPSVSVNGTAMVDVLAARKDGTPVSANEISWVSSNPEIASADTADDGHLKVKGYKAGKVKITGYAKDGSGKKVTFNLNVSQLAEGITIQGYERVSQGKSVTLKAEMTPENVNNKKVAWSIESGASGVKISSSGKLSIPTDAAGSVVLKAEALDGSGVTAYHEVSIASSAISKIAVSKKTVKLYKKSNDFSSVSDMNLDVTVNGGETDNWIVESSNETIVKAVKENGQLRLMATGKGVGNAVITVTAADGSNKKAKCKVTVLNPLTGLQLAPEYGRSEYYIAKGKRLKLDAVLEASYGPLNASQQKLKWESSNKAVKVDKKGNVKAVKGGYNEAVITVTSLEDSSMKASYTVRTCDQTVGIDLQVPKNSTLDPDVPYSKSNNMVPLNNGTVWQIVPSYIYYKNTLKKDNKLSEEYNVEVDKPGLSAYIKKVPGRDEMGNDIMIGILYLIGNKEGEYTVTLSSSDGSKAKKSFKFRVVDMGYSREDIVLGTDTVLYKSEKALTFPFAP